MEETGHLVFFFLSVFGYVYFDFYVLKEIHDSINLRKWSWASIFITMLRVSFLFYMFAFEKCHDHLKLILKSYKPILER